MINKVKKAFKIPCPNPADDASFRELEHLIAQRVHLWNGVNRRLKQMEELEKRIMSESSRLSVIGYDITKLKPTVIEGFEL